MIEVGDILYSDGWQTSRVIDVNQVEGYCTVLLTSDIDGPIDSDEDNIAEFVLLNDIYERNKYLITI